MIVWMVQRTRKKEKRTTKPHSNGSSKYGCGGGKGSVSDDTSETNAQSWIKISIFSRKKSSFAFLVTLCPLTMMLLIVLIHAEKSISSSEHVVLINAVFDRRDNVSEFWGRPLLCKRRAKLSNAMVVTQGSPLFDYFITSSSFQICIDTARSIPQTVETDTHVKI